MTLYQAILEGARPRAFKPVFPLYVMSRVRRGIALPDPNAPVELTAGEIETLGDCRYALRVTDSAGTAYRVTVEVAESKP